MKKVVLLDGGMGQELLKRSANKPHPMWSAKVLMDEPDIVETVHCDFIKAGARVITLNNYSVTPERLARDASPDLFDKLQASAIDIAQRARDKAAAKYGTKVRIAGCLPPLVASYCPDTAPSFEECINQYQTLVAAQEKSVDLLLCETMSSIREAKAAIMAAKDSKLSVWVSFTLEDSDRACLRSGESLKDAIDMVNLLGVEAVLLNCSVPEAITSAVDTLVTQTDSICGAYANGFTSIEALKPGGTVDSLTARKDLGPTAYAEMAMKWVGRGVSIVGGCCEVGPDHIAVLQDRLLKAGYQMTDHL